MSELADSITPENVVASSAIGQEIDIESLAMDLVGAEYDPDQFPGLVYRLSEPKTAILIFRSGKIVCTGGDSIEAVNEAVSRVFDQLRDLGIDVPGDPNISIQNIVSSANLGSQLNLNALAIGLGLEDVEYEPEQFPGLVYRLDEPNVVVLLFGSGKLVVTGGKTMADAGDAVEVVQSRLTELGMLE